MTAPRAGSSKAVAARTDRAVRELTRLFKALADESRVRILFLLARDGELSVSTLGAELGQSQPTVSHHLTQLRDAGLVDYRRDGKFNYYALSPEGLAEIVARLFPAGPARVSVGGLEVSFKSRK